MSYLQGLKDGERKFEAFYPSRINHYLDIIEICKCVRHVRKGKGVDYWKGYYDAMVHHYNLNQRLKGGE